MRKRVIILALLAAILMPAGSATASPLETLMGLTMGFETTVPIIMYHALDKSPDNIWEITAQEFEADLEYLSKNGYTTVVMQDLVGFVHHGKPLPEKPIVLSFDDGRRLDEVLPMLEQYDARITMAIIGQETDHYTEIGRGKHPHMTWDEVKAAADTGRVEIQSHTYGLHGAKGAGKRRGESNEAYRQRFLADLHKFADVLRQNTGIVPNSLAYPLGIISPTSDDIIKEAGYSASLSCQEKNNRLAVGDLDCLFSLSRFLRPPGKTSDSFFAKLEEGKTAESQ
ncbi:MAG: polysaccharide deacetylase family protein [Defluviitaleaceae bacterium]|nr:polysaccharide deacetylase family protein [Defluviitaleaceae bacterium]